MKAFDLHCDTLTECGSLWENDCQLSLSRGAELSPWVQCFAVFIPDSLRGKPAADFFDKAVEKFRSELRENPGRITRCRTVSDLEKARVGAGCHAILTVEGGAVLAGDLSRVEVLAQCGVRALTLTWNSTCELGDGAGVEQARGLSPFGRKAVAALERRHIAVDVSHASDALFYDVAQCAAQPFLATHSNARAVCPHRRNLTDEQFREIARRGGVVGVNFVPSFLNSQPEKAGPQDVVRHMEHFLALGGEKTVALGSDFDGTALPQGISGVEFLGELAELLLCRNYSESLVEDIFFENAYRFFHSL